MKKLWLLLVPLLAACAPYYGPRDFWGPRERDFFEALAGFLFLILIVLLTAAVVVWVLRQGPWSQLKDTVLPSPLRWHPASGPLGKLQDRCHLTGASN